MTTQFQNVHVIINPASGRDEPILNPINEIFARYDIPWEAHVTHKAGDATRLTKDALRAGADLIVSYGGDGTMMEVVNGMIGQNVPLALLAGGTGNGVATELGIPTDLRQALQLIAESPARRKLDAGRCDDHYFMLRAFVGLPEDYVPDRETKDSIGFLSYPISAIRFINERSSVRYRIAIDDFEFEEDGILCLVNNVGYSNAPKRLEDLVERTFLNVQVHQGKETTTAEASVFNTISPDDGLLDVIIVTGTKSLLQSLVTLPIRDRGEPLAKVHFFQGKRILVEATPAQEIRLDGEEGGKTPCQIEVVPQAVEVIVSA